MKSRFFSIICFVLALALMTMAPLDGLHAFPAAFAEETELTEIQRNAIGMLNYLTVLTKEINESKNSRLYMEEVYSTILSNTNPNAVQDRQTREKLEDLLDTLEHYRMIDVKRERLQYIYEQNQAKALRESIPNPMGLLSAVESGDYVRMAASVIYMAIDSYASYTAFTSEADLKYLQDGWALDDEEAGILHNSRKEAFSYMLKIVADYGLPGELALSEAAVDEFVSWKNNTNVVARIQFLESNQKTYQSYGEYWLMLAQSYYENGDFEKCLESFATYEALDIRIFRRDYAMAKTLPMIIVALQEVLSEEEYVMEAARCTNLILDNTEHDDWALRYFAAQTYVELYGKTGDLRYLQRAYDIALDNVNYLVNDQRRLNAAYLAPLQTVDVPKDADKQEKKDIENYNKLLKVERKAALAPISEPLRLNCDLLYALAEKLDLPEREQIKVDKILHQDGEALFLVAELDAMYTFENLDDTTEGGEIEVAFNGKELTLPAIHVTEDTAILVSVQEAGEAAEEFTDWAISKVERPKEGEMETFRATFTSKTAKKYSYKADAAIIIKVVPTSDENAKVLTFSFKTVSAKTEWYEHAQFWNDDIAFQQEK